MSPKKKTVVMVGTNQHNHCIHTARVSKYRNRVYGAYQTRIECSIVSSSRRGAEVRSMGA